MEEKSGTGEKVLFFLMGGFFGAAIALLFAPKSGEETRELLAERARQGRDLVTRKTRELQEQASEYLEKGRDVVAKQKEQVAAAIEAGKQAFREEREKVKPQ
ncbi:MAG: YtxH domain-containing protein [Acidobacteria bacterium]|nr:YtxH domain-containing protein [Acidobacteriota bacterium]